MDQGNETVAESTSLLPKLGRIKPKTKPEAKAKHQGSVPWEEHVSTTNCSTHETSQESYGIMLLRRSKPKIMLGLWASVCMMSWPGSMRFASASVCSKVSTSSAIWGCCSNSLQH
jgi:hypothetical protein